MTAHDVARNALIVLLAVVIVALVDACHRGWL